MATRIRLLFVSLITSIFIASGIACSEGPMERAGKAVDEAVEDTGEALEDAKESVEDAIEEKEEEKEKKKKESS